MVSSLALDSETDCPVRSFDSVNRSANCCNLPSPDEKIMSVRI